MPHLTQQTAGPTRRAGVALALAGWLAIALATLTPTRGADTTASAGCVACDPGWGADLLANVVLFVPLGAGLALAGVRARRALALVAVTTLTVELLQVAFVPGRDASLRDLATNFAGGAAAWLAMHRRGWLLGARSARAAALAAVWAAAWIGGTAISAWAFTPSLPASLWWAHWNPPSVAASAARAGAGTAVLGADVDGRPLAPGAVEQWPALRQRLLAGDALTVRAVVAPRDGESDGDIAVVDDADTEQELLSFRRRGDAVAFYFRTRGAALRLRSPAVSTGAVLSPTGADTVRLAGTFSRGHLRVAAERAGAQRVTRSLAVTPDWGWSFFAPASYAFGPETRLLTAIWVALLVLPIAFWAARAHVTGERTIVRATARLAFVAPALALAVIPALYALAPVHWSEWLAWAVGTALGVAAGRIQARRASAVRDGAHSHQASHPQTGPLTAAAAATRAPAAWRGPNHLNAGAVE